MRGGVSDRSSILLLGRNTVVIGAVLITIASFGIGYFFGFRGSSPSEQEKPVVQAAKTAETVPLEEKQVVDLPVKDNTGNAVSSQIAPANRPEPEGESVPEKQLQPTAEGSKPKVKIETEPSGKPKTPVDQYPKIGKNDIKAAASAANQEQADVSVQSVQSGQSEKTTVIAPKSRRHAGAKAKTRAKSSVPSGKLYAVQIGAFPNKEGAEQLFQNLKASGYSPYIINGGENNAYYKVRIGTFKKKKDAEKSAAELLKKTGLQNFITASQ